VPTLLGAIDQGTSSTRFIVFDESMGDDEQPANLRSLPSAPPAIVKRRG
jgi:glycerol kinase